MDKRPAGLPDEADEPAPDSAPASSGPSSAATPAGALAGNVNLDFNVESLNLDSLGGLVGLDFDVSSLLKQVSGSTAPALSAGAGAVAGGAVAEPPSAGDMPDQPLSAPEARVAESSAAAPGRAAGGSDGQSAAVGQTSLAGPGAGTDTTPPAMASANPAPSTGSGHPALASMPQTTPVRPGAPRQTSPARPVRPPGSIGTPPPRPRPVRPPGVQGSGSPGPTRPPPGTSPGPRPGPTGAPRPGTVRPGQPGARPRPAAPTATAPATATATATAAGGAATVRPGTRPVQRPRPPMRPGVAGARPAPRPGMRPAMRPAGHPGTPRPAPSGPTATATRPAAPEAAAAAQGGRPPAVRPAQQPSAAPPQAPGTGSVKAGPAAGEAAPVASEADVHPVPAAAVADDGGGLGGSAVASEESWLSESVVVTSPALVPAPHGFGPLYDVESVFRSLCHGISPTNAEWSSLNILAVTWPQLEAAPADNRRLAQRDISDVSSMSVADSVRSLEERRPPSSAIHLFRLHVNPPAAWGADTNVAPIQPSLLPLCELRMQQQWDEQVSRANMDRLVDAFSIDQLDDHGPEEEEQHQPQQQCAGGPGWQCSSLNVSPLSGWRAGMSQAGAGEQMRVTSAPRCAWSADCRMLAAGDSAGRFEIFQVQEELNSWRSVYHIDFDHPVVACLWLANARKYGISRHSSGPADSAAPSPGTTTNWDVDPSIGIRRLPFFGPRNTHGEYALVVATADGQLALVYQRDEEWARVVAALRPDPHEPKAAAAAGGPWSNVPRGTITHADMMLVSKKWIYLTVHRAGAAPAKYPHEPGAIPDGLARDGAIMAPMVEVYRIQVEFASDYSPRLFAAPLVVQPIILGTGPDPAGADPPRITHLKLITALNPEVRPVEQNVLGENHYFPLLFVSLGAMPAGGPAARATTAIQVWRLEGAPHAQRPTADQFRRAPPLRLAHMWTEQRQGLLLSVIANRAERQQLRYLFAKPSDKDYRTLMLTWADGRVETLRNYQDHGPAAAGADCFEQCVAPVRSPAEWVIGSVLSPHYTAYFQLVVRPHAVELGTKQGSAAAAAMDVDPAGHGGRVKPDAAVACMWSQSHARFRLGWTPLVADLAGAVNADVQAYCGDLLAVRTLNKEDPADLVAMLANVATLEENQPMPTREADPAAGRDGGHDVLAAPMSRTLLQALFRACTLLAGALRIKALDLDPLSSTTPYVRRLLGAIMQAQFLAQHNIQATSLGLLLHAASVIEARVGIVHEHLLQAVTPSQSIFDVAKRFSPDWRRLFPSTAALVLWSIDLLVALTRDTYLYFNVRCADRQGAMRPLCEAGAPDSEAVCLQSFTGEPAGGLGDACLLPGWIPSRLALLFHRPTLDAVRGLLTFVAHLEADMLQRIRIINSLPPNAAAIPDYADMVQSRDMLLSAAQQLAHALEYLPVSMQRLKDFLAEVQDLYAADDECMSVASQAMLVATSAVTGPFRKYLPDVARSFARHVLEPNATQHALGRPAVPAALVLHDTRWIGALACRANAPGLPDGTTVFETPWRVELPVVVADAGLIDADETTLVPAAEVAEWGRERTAFERALDEDNVLFDIDDPGFIFFDTSASPDGGTDDDALQSPVTGGIFADVVSGAAAQAPVRITTKVPDFSDVAGLYVAAERMRITDASADHMFSLPVPFDTTHVPAAQALFGMAADAAPGGPPLGRASSGPSCTTPMSAVPGAGGSPTPPSLGPGPARGRPRHAAAQHFVPHYSNAAPGSGGELCTGWQFVSMPQYPKLHIPTLLAQHACSLAVLAQKHGAQQQPGHSCTSAATADGACRDMAYYIDWSRSEGIVIESTLASGLSGVAAAAAAAVAAAAAAATAAPQGGYSKSARPSVSLGVDRVDVVQKTMLPADAPVKMCLRCGHLTRRTPADTSGPGEIAWIRRFGVLCVCGGSWIAL